MSNSNQAPMTAMTNAINSGHNKYNASSQGIKPKPQWNSYVSQNYHAAKVMTNMPHNQIMKSLSSNYRGAKK